jgi:hypothetical protein
MLFEKRRPDYGTFFNYALCQDAEQAPISAEVAV